MIWRYFSVHEFCALVIEEFLIFRQFTDLLRSDSAEGKFPPSLVDEGINDKNLEPTQKAFYVSCWSKFEHENSLMWKAYAPRGLAIKTTKRKLLRTLSLINNNEDEDKYVSSFVAYDVDYLDDNEFIEWNDSEARIGQILSRKRRAFTSENELRILYLDSDSTSWATYRDQKRWLLVPLRTFDWIDAVILDPFLAGWVNDWIERLLKTRSLTLEESNAD